MKLTPYHAKYIAHELTRRYASDSVENVKYTNRHALVQEFVPTPEEQRLYDVVSEYLRQPTLYALPASQRSLMTLILRKLLASSTYAISDTLNGLAQKLKTYELLDEKFRLFSGVFGASDEVLGSIESGVDFEKRIAGIYQKCRTPEQIQFEFDQLQRELDEDITAGQRDAREKLLDNFDQEVIEKVRVQSAGLLDRFNEMEKLYRWSEDVKRSLETEIKDLDREIRELRCASALAQSLQDKLPHQKDIRELERRRTSKRRELFTAQDEIDARREELIGKVEAKLQQACSLSPLFTIRWSIP
ncbi:MAG: hypothetical protein U1E05_13850 [Patescibacteria group bacterium]|nr:hypothetical protein [Patescibacteria group bacterium]